jgi:hypothetical protein
MMTEAERTEQINERARAAARVADAAIAESLETGKPVELEYDEVLSDHLRMRWGNWNPTAAHTVTYSGVLEKKRWTVQLVPKTTRGTSG